MKKLPIYLLVAVMFTSMSAIVPRVSHAMDSNHLEFTTEVDCTAQSDGGRCISGQLLSVQPVVTVKDSMGVVDTLYSGNVTIEVTTGSGTLSGITTVAAINGVATFTNLVYHAGSDNEGVSFVAVATDGPNPGEIAMPMSGPSQAFTSDVIATQFTIAADKGRVRPPIDINCPDCKRVTNISVSATDSNGITDNDYSPTGKVFSFKDGDNMPLSTHISPKGNAPEIPSDSEIISLFDKGSANIGIGFTKAEDLGTISISDGNLIGTASDFVVKTGQPYSFIVTPSTTTPMAGRAFDLTIAAVDNEDNVLSNNDNPYTGTIDIETSAQAPYVLAPSIYVFKAEDRGIKTFTKAVTLNKAESGVIITVNQIVASVDQHTNPA
jgi:hypothetical protein